MDKKAIELNHIIDLICIDYGCLNLTKPHCLDTLQYVLSEKISDFISTHYISRKDSEILVNTILEDRDKNFVRKDEVELDEEKVEKELRANFDSFFHQVYFYIEIQDWYDKGIKATTQALCAKGKDVMK